MLYILIFNKENILLNFDNHIGFDISYDQEIIIKVRYNTQTLNRKDIADNFLKNRILNSTKGPKDILKI